MNKLLLLVLFVGSALSRKYIENHPKPHRCTRSIVECNVVDPVTNTTSVEVIDNCQHLCCGGKVVERGVGIACCGDEEIGEAYNENDQICCFQRPDVNVYDRETPDDFCCGAERFNNEKYANGFSCCTGYLTQPKPFNVLTEMCCEGMVSFVGDTAYGNCCGNVGFDRRAASCPCLVAPPIFGGPEELDRIGCCQSGDQSRSENYNQDSQGCCDGTAYALEGEICCGDVVGEADKHVCCDGDLVDRKPGDDPTHTGCCSLDDGTVMTYNMETEICCGNEVLPMDEPSICCSGKVHLVTSEGDACCDSVNGSLPYFKNKQVCCNGFVGTGQACCGDSAYYPRDQLCCQGKPGSSDSVWPSCCGGEPYDAYVQTCCGSRVLDNPMVETFTGEAMEVSHFTRCCGDFQDESTLVAYDYFSGTCCNGNVNTIDFIDFGAAECCGNVTVGADQICCDQGAFPRDFGDDTGCCGEGVIDLTSSICCAGLPRALDGISPERAQCCGDACMDAGAFYCCEGKVYNKAEISHDEFDKMSCNIPIEEEEEST